LSNKSDGQRATESLTSQAAGGFVWTLVQILGSKVVGLLGQIILARLLLPRDFGLLAITMIAVSFASVIRQTGIQQILVQRHKNFRRWANPAFWFELSFGTATAVLLAAASPIAAAVFHSHALIGLILVSASAAPLSAWFVVPTARLMIDMRFRAIAVVNIATNILLTLLSVFLAWRGFGAYSFLIPIPISGAVRCIWLWMLARPRIRLHPQLRRWRFLIGDSGFMIATGFLNSVIYQAGYLVLGLLYQKSVVGQFFFALNLSNQVAYLLSQNLGNVLLPALAKLQDDAARHAAALVRALRMLTFISTPACLLLVVVAEPFVVIIYSAKWTPAVPILQLMAAASAISIPCTPAVAAIQSRGRFSLLFWWTLVQTPVFIGAIFAGAWFGAGIGVAVAWLFFSLVASPITVRLALFKGAAWRGVFGVYTGPFLASVLAFTPAFLVDWVWPRLGAHLLASGAIAAACLGVLYPLIARWFCPAEFAQFMGHLSAPVRKFFTMRGEAQGR
jgi:lipopolysaccharide exporter